MTTVTGTIARLTDRGFGFITPADGGDKDVFFHARSLDGIEYDDLREGDSVEFDVENGPKGPSAINIRRGGSAPAPAKDDDAGTDASDDSSDDAAEDKPAEEEAA